MTKELVPESHKTIRHAFTCVCLATFMCITVFKASSCYGEFKDAEKTECPQQLQECNSKLSTKISTIKRECNIRVKTVEKQYSAKIDSVKNLICSE